MNFTDCHKQFTGPMKNILIVIYYLLGITKLVINFGQLHPATMLIVYNRQSGVVRL